MSIFKDVRTELGKLDQDRRALRSFAVVMALALAVIAAVIYWKGNHPERAAWFLAISVLFLGTGLTVPQVLKPAHKIWMGLAFFMGWVMSRLILSALFYLIVSPIGLIMRLFSKDFLDVRIDRQAASYWSKREEKETPRERYLRLY